MSYQANQPGTQLTPEEEIILDDLLDLGDPGDVSIVNPGGNGYTFGPMPSMEEWLLPPVEDWWDISTGLPPDPEVGDRWICDGFDEELGWYDGYIYEWTGSEWEETMPYEGYMFWMIAELLFYVFFSGGWMEVGSSSFLNLEETNWTADSPLSFDTDTKHLSIDLSNKLGDSFESVSKNIKAYPYVLNYTDEQLTSIVYTVPTGIITKTFNYTDEVLNSIVLSGNTPDGISLTKSFTYVGENVSEITYS